MNFPDPQDAPSRQDLPFLRHRTRPKAAPAAAGAVTSTVLADFVASRGARPNPRTGAGVPMQAELMPRAPGSTSLDLSPTTPAVPPASPVPTRRRAPSRIRDVARTRDGTTVLTGKTPTVTLTRLQSGIGALTIEARCSNEVDDLRLGCAYQLRSGNTSTLQRADGRSSAPANSTRPIIAAQRDRYEQLSLDLRQCQEIERLIIYGYSESGAELRWGGALVITTSGGSRVEVPLDGNPSRGVRVILSLYNIRGEFVLRSEMETVSGSVRDACHAYGFDRITWLDGHTPLG